MPEAPLGFPGNGVHLEGNKEGPLWVLDKEGSGYSWAPPALSAARGWLREGRQDPVALEGLGVAFTTTH